MKNYILGIDIGSTTTKGVLLDQDKVIYRTLTPSTSIPIKAIDLIIKNSLKKIENKSDPDIVCTGYGRRLLKKSKKIVTEISAAAAGAYNINHNKECLLLDIGGQDTKVIELDNSGKIIDFLMNDKCAAGTGRFLEIMANILSTNIQNFSELAEKSNKKITINSTCSVFAESEVISLINSSKNKADIAAGIFVSIATRISFMLKNFSEKKQILVCGGGANSVFLIKSLEKISKRKIKTLPDPQFVAAYGAVLSLNN